MNTSIFGLSAKALVLREQRSEILSNNLVNNSTPNFKARDIDFKTMLKQQNDQLQLQSNLTRTHKSHIQNAQSLSTTDLKYRVPSQPSLDGNTVDPDLENANFLDNALQYQMNLTFIRGKTRTILAAIKGQ